MRVYLDSSAIVKRYIEEDGSETVAEFYEKALDGEITLAFSIWNVGEVLGVLDKYLARGWISRSEYNTALASFRRETKRLIRLGILKVVLVKNRLLASS
ncbi:type II toxin-antitoxin system VapC family toxin [Hyperthermus butylicus]|uniref:Conserved archaeal protein n=1 Tax=Hyperthermus butylicus (strain DSM 5456 / JCM 9403 / PLM1-5) TaxID=415426 RepID=A2BJ60_HYPBU|nr:type II toxin-antitoxin system VapC family toxin [Hyperthermus butylicus]ABM80021.1 conserved archaeal protein [Hyperthermus butylicus DSM 5456]